MAEFRLPMGIKINPDKAQTNMEEILQGLNITCYIDYLGIGANGTIDEHLELVNKVIQMIAATILKTNPLKATE